MTLSSNEAEGDVKGCRPFKNYQFSEPSATHPKHCLISRHAWLFPSIQSGAGPSLLFAKVRTRRVDRAFDIRAIGKEVSTPSRLILEDVVFVAGREANA